MDGVLPGGETNVRAVEGVGDPTPGVCRVQDRFAYSLEMALV